MGGQAKSADRQPGLTWRPDCWAGQRPPSPVVIYVVPSRTNPCPWPVIRAGGCQTPVPVPVEPAGFMRAGDLICRVSGGDRRATETDIDHIIGFADDGPTSHPT